MDIKIRRECSILKKEAQSWIKSSMEDPLAKILASGSHLTKVQLETILIDVLAENLASKSLKYAEKAKLRQTKAAVSRGSFNRTLQQAKKNVIRSIYTLLLLGYFGILEDTSLSSYLEVANKLKAYTAAYKDIIANPTRRKEQIQVIAMLREELQATLSRLSKPWTSSRT